MSGSETVLGKSSSRPEGAAREQAGRFSRDSWDGATAALPDYLYSDATPRILTTPRASAYIKITEGCDHPCSFCIIPQLRGKFRSRRIGSILAEAQNLIAGGVRELTLIGQDTTCYGEDLGLKDGLAQLLDALAQLEGLRWLRFLYTYPTKVTTRLLETMARHPGVIAPYLDVPLQHASPSVLKTMKRGGNAEILPPAHRESPRDRPRHRHPHLLHRRLSRRNRGRLPNPLRLRPVRQDRLARRLHLLRRRRRPRLHPSTTRPRSPPAPSRPAAANSCASSKRSPSNPNAPWVGRQLDVLGEGPSEETDLLWEGRTLLQAPEIDGKLFLNDFGPHETLIPGTFYRAEITESHDYDLVARILD